MTIKELIETLQNYDENMEVMFKDSGDYVYTPTTERVREVRMFWGKDRDCLVFKTEQKGMV